MPEHWETDAGDHGVALLDIPADAFRDRTFEVAIDFAVKAVPDADGPAALHSYRDDVDPGHAAIASYRD